MVDDAPGIALLDAVEHDLDAFADALHDGPLQSLVVARYAADAAVRGGDAAAVRDAVQQALVELRLLLWTLRPRGDAGLVEALEGLAVHLGSPISVTGDAAELTGLSSVAGTCAYRLVQALACVDAPPVQVVVRREGALLELTVTGGRSLAGDAGWVSRARAVGGDLSPTPAGLVLLLPAPPSFPGTGTAGPRTPAPTSSAAPAAEVSPCNPKAAP